MPTRALMIAAALFLGLLGLAMTFLPQELLDASGSPVTRLAVLVLQLAGALYLGFAMLDWMARGILIGGVYARPLALGNFLYFTVAMLALLKSSALPSPLIQAMAVVCHGTFALSFGLVLFTHPAPRD